MEEFVGKRFGKLEVLNELPAVRDNSGTLRRWMEVKCDCGQIVEKKLKYLKNGDTTTCGNCIYEVVDKSLKGLDVVGIDPTTDEMNMIGNAYQRWLVTQVGFRSGKQRMVKAVCECGVERVVSKSALLSGHSISCGCYAAEQISKVLTTHGQSGVTNTYNSWANMVQRCTNPNHTQYHDYGGRGIGFPTKWKTFEGFFEDMGECPEGLTIERHDVNLSYSIENCSWEDMHTQAWNRRTFKNNTSGKTGVVFNKRQGSWVSTINFKSVKFHLGTYDSYEDAVEARVAAEIKYYGKPKE